MAAKFEENFLHAVPCMPARVERVYPFEGIENSSRETDADGKLLRK